MGSGAAGDVLEPLRQPGVLGPRRLRLRRPPIPLRDEARVLLRRLAQAGVTPDQLDAVLLTHYHTDHCADIAALLFALRSPDLRHRQPLTIYGAPGLRRLVDKLTEALGFKYKRAGKEYTHPGGVSIVSPERKIVRYLYGLQFLPFDFEMGVYEAMQGKVRPTTARLLQFCFSYDPEGRSYVFNFTRVIAVVMLTSVLFFIAFLVYTTRGRRRGKEA